MDWSAYLCNIWIELVIKTVSVYGCFALNILSYLSICNVCITPEFVSLIDWQICSVYLYCRIVLPWQMWPQPNDVKKANHTVRCLACVVIRWRTIGSIAPMHRFPVCVCVCACNVSSVCLILRPIATRAKKWCPLLLMVTVFPHAYFLLSIPTFSIFIVMLDRPLSVVVWTQVQTIKIIGSRKSKPPSIYAYLIMETPEAAGRLVNGLQGTSFGDNQIKLKRVS